MFDLVNGGLAARIPVGMNPHGLTVWPQPGRFSLGHTGNRLEDQLPMRFESVAHPGETPGPSLVVPHGLVMGHGVHALFETGRLGQCRQRRPRFGKGIPVLEQHCE